MLEEKQVIERVYEVLRLKCKSINAAAKMMGFTQSTLSSAKDRGNVNFQIVAAVLNTFQDISPDWLLFGRGDMLRAAPGTDKTALELLNALLKILKRQSRELEDVKKAYANKLNTTI